MELLNYIVSAFLIELVVDFLLLRILKINMKFLYVLFLQIPKVCANVFCGYFSVDIFVKLGVKFLSKILSLFFLTDSFKFKRLVQILFLQYIILFSFGGFIEFLVKVFCLSVDDVFCAKTPKNYQFFVIFLIILYIFAFFKLIRFLEKNRFLRNHLAKVSLTIMNKHISFYGLADSGNSLYDKVTGLPVVILSSYFLKTIFNDEEVNFFIQKHCRKIECETLSNCKLTLPIFLTNDFRFEIDSKQCSVKCCIAITNQNFENGKYECLLHKDFCGWR